jgi:uncharacterized membrane protein YfcA
MMVEFWGQQFRVNIAVACLGAFLTAVVASMVGLAGGPLVVALMTLALGLPMYLVVGSSLLAIFFNTVMGSLRHIQFGNFEPTLFLVMFPAALIGGFVGPRIARRVSPTWVKRIAALGLLALALNLLGIS